jgi:CRISPR type IV-associated protein Csf3
MIIKSAPIRDKDFIISYVREINKATFAAGSGKRKAYVLNINPMTGLEKIVFYGCGDMEKVEELLQLIPAMGNKRNLGYGKIAKIKIKERKYD